MIDMTNMVTLEFSDDQKYFHIRRKNESTSVYYDEVSTCPEWYAKSFTDSFYNRYPIKNDDWNFNNVMKEFGLFEVHMSLLKHFQNFYNVELFEKSAKIEEDEK